jgi:5'-nucleotidase
VDVFYSGTVAGAMEGALHGIDSVAVSTDRENADRIDRVARIAADVVEDLCALGLPAGWLMNVNIPELGPEEPPVRYTRQSPVFPGGVLSRTDGTRGRVHYWLDAAVEAERAPQDSDVAVLAEGHVSVTPLSCNLTDTDVLENLRTCPAGGGQP